MPARLVGLEADELRFVVLAPGKPGMLPTHGRGRVSLHVSNRAWAFEGELRRTGGDIRISRPDELRPLQQRVSARIAAPPGMTVLFSVGDTVLRRPVLDLSARGLGVALLGEGGEPAAGAALAEVQFTLPLGPPIAGAAAVRHIRTLPSGQRQAGFDLLGLHGADAKRLDAWVRGQTRTGRREAARRAVQAFADTRVVLAAEGAPRTRVVLDATLEGVTLSAEALDRDLTPGATLEAVELWRGEDRVLRAPARVLDAVVHRGRPVQVELAWCAPPVEAVAALVKLLERVR